MLATTANATGGSRSYEKAYTHINMAWEEKHRDLWVIFYKAVRTCGNLTETEWDEGEKKGKKKARERPNTHILHIFAMPKMST